jgi:hypothetical protein
VFRAAAAFTLAGYLSLGLVLPVEMADGANHSAGPDTVNHLREGGARGVVSGWVCIASLIAPFTCIVQSKPKKCQNCMKVMML